MSFLSCAEMLTYAHEHSCTLAQAVLRSDLAESRLTEEASRAQMRRLWQVMQQTSRDYDPSRRSRSGLVGGDAAKVEQAAAQLARANARLAQAEPAAAAYAQIKDRTAGIELEAHCRAQEVQQAAEEKVQRAHTEVSQWLHKVQAGYDLLRSDMEGAVSRATQELDKLHQMVEQLSSHFDSQDEHLHKLTQDCISEFAPPAPEPLPLNEK